MLLQCKLHLVAYSKPSRLYWPFPRSRYVSESAQHYAYDSWIVAIDCVIAVRMTMNPALPSDHCFLLQHMPVGHLTKFIATYSTAFWRSHGYSGEVVSSSPLSDRVEQVAADAGISLAGCITYSPVCCVWDATTEDGLPALVGIQGGKAATQWSGQPVYHSFTL